MILIRYFICVPLFLCGLVSFVAAEPPLPLETQSVISLGLAQQAAEAALKQCASDGYKISVAVVGPEGVLRILLRADGAGPHTIDSSKKKAYTAASMRRATSFFSDLIEKKPNLAGLRDMNKDILILGGGLPIVIAGEIVGGIGVGGAPGAHLDEACAETGLRKIGAGSKK